MTAITFDTSDSDKAPTSTLVLLGEEEFVLRASRTRVVFENYNRDGEASGDQSITLNLDNGHAQHADSPVEADNTSVPIILSPPSTARFELALNDSTSSSPSLKAVLSRGSPLTCTVRFKRPRVDESDYAWDNFQDRFVVHTRLSKLVIHLEAWKNGVASFSRDQESSLLFPASLPEVKAPPLKLFGALERNAVRQGASSPCLTEITKTSLVSEQNNVASNAEVLRSPRTEALPYLSRPGSRERQSSPSLSSRVNPAISPPVNDGSSARPEVTAVQSQREAREVIMKLRRRRTLQSKASSSTSATEPDSFPETVALDANTKADLEEFNNLVIAARDHITKETAKAKNELAYYQQLLPVPPPRSSTPETPSPVAQKTRKNRQMSAATRRPSKLPSLVRPSSNVAIVSASTANDTMCSITNQELSPLEQVPQRRSCSARQRIRRTTKPQSLSALLDDVQVLQPQKEVSNLPTTTTRRKSINNQLQQEQVDELSDFDDPDPEVDDAPVLPDDLSGVATLEADELL
ncbi:hypothetical protein PF011_g2681 [Phytophthora fragariae]|uniref:Uncharacterized protein n=1 Tax=Phytophthora fragariae TaxID=53985 RepID=A0A6A3M701_9STRA|nr:hypothetical protein PF011_g2681 [Phytophthora fragariae]